MIKVQFLNRYSKRFVRSLDHSLPLDFFVAIAIATYLSIEEDLIVFRSAAAVRPED